MAQLDSEKFICDYDGQNKAKYFNLLHIFYLQSFRKKGPPTLMIFSAKGHYTEWEELTCRF